MGRVESLKLVVDKVTSISKGIAYIEYPTIEDAEYFMLKNYRKGGFYLEVEGYKKKNYYYPDIQNLDYSYKYYQIFLAIMWNWNIA